MRDDLVAVSVTISDIEVVKSGLDASTFLWGMARRKAMESGKKVTMIEHRIDEQTKMHQMQVWMKGE